MTSKYESVRTHDDNFEDVIVYEKRPTSPDSLASTLMEDDDHSFKEPTRRISSRWVWLVHALLLSVSFSLFVSTYYLRGSTLRHVQQFSAWSPAAEVVEYVKVKYNNTMMSPYIGKGPEVDKAWNAISYDTGDQTIEISDLKKIDMPESALKYTDPKTGAVKVRVGLEVFHQLHCVNLLRQVTYRDWYEDISGEFHEGQEALQKHTDHCLEILRKSIECNADIGVFTLYKHADDQLPWPELNTWHTCRNFDKIRDWAMENTIGNVQRPDVHPVIPEGKI
ncbi:hypothetical protein BP6252_10318 [Coleophoma cylindrospora]|uniref:Tat pathway signal sequence n=1 Tax=Coleophoma cylindrospora TaxID=1849047 RepID=A0A3D8QSB1_9HELO|nr:hypothetical protein BP6252_10318 [Coleophoma cylindrospora]